MLTTWSRMRLASVLAVGGLNSAGSSPRENCEGEMIKKTKAGYKVTSSKGKNLGGPYKSKEAARKRLRQVEYFKHAK